MELIDRSNSLSVLKFHLPTQWLCRHPATGAPEPCTPMYAPPGPVVWRSANGQRQNSHISPPVE